MRRVTIVCDIEEDDEGTPADERMIRQEADETYQRTLGKRGEDVEGEGYVKHISVTVEPSHGGYMTSHRMTDALRAFADVLTEAAGTEEERKARYDKMIKDVTGG